MRDFEQQLIDCIPKLRGFVRRLTRDEQLVDDIAQDVLLKVWKSRRSFRGDSELSTWLYIIAKNTVLNYYRKDQLIQFVDKTDEESVSFNPLSGFLCRDILRKCGGRVLSKQQKRILFEAMQGETMDDIARTLSMAEGTVKSQLHRARRRLKKESIFAYS